MISLRYGTPPIVHATGGLGDTVRDEHGHPGAGTGFVFRHPTADGLLWACREFARRFRTGGGAWESLLERGMAVDFDWRSGSAPAYLTAYRRAIALRRAIAPRLATAPATARRGPRIDRPTKMESPSGASDVERLNRGPIRG